MAVQDHLKIASSEILKAADLLRQEINDLRSEEANLQKMISEDIARLTSQIQIREKEVSVTGEESARAQGQTTINNLVKEIADAKNRLQSDRQRIQSTIREKEQLINTFNQQARAIQS